MQDQERRQRRRPSWDELRSKVRIAFVLGLIAGMLVTAVIVAAVLLVVFTRTNPMPDSVEKSGMYNDMTEVAQATPIPMTSATAVPKPEDTPAPTPTPEPTEAVPTEVPVTAGQVLFGGSASHATAVPNVTAVPNLNPTEAPTPEAIYPPSADTTGGDYRVLTGLPQTDRPLGVDTGNYVPDSWFDDAVFIGDRVTAQLAAYVENQRLTNPTLLGGATFLATDSLSCGTALAPVSETSAHPTVNGEKMSLEDAVYMLDARKVFIMLGTNDLAAYGVEGSVSNLSRMLTLIREKTPDAQIYIQTVTPRAATSASLPSNQSLFEYDLALYKQSITAGLRLVDVAYVMRDEAGTLSMDYCADPQGTGLGLNDDACAEWISYLYTHTGA